MIYLNNAAGTKPYPEVIDAITNVLHDFWGNPHDSNSFGNTASQLIRSSTISVAEDINCNEDEIIWTSGACEANSLALLGVLNNNPHTKLYTSNLEHSSINELVTNLPHNTADTIINDNDGLLDLNQLETIMHWHYMRNTDVLISISFANSEIGTIQDIKSIAKIVHKYDGILHVDATQMYPWYRIDVKDLGIDMMSVSGQKLHCVKGIGFLYVRNGIELKPLIYGTQQGGHRGGTMPTHLIYAFNSALFVTRGLDVSRRHSVQKMRDYMQNKLLEIDDVHLNGPLMNRLPNNISLTIDGVNAETLVAQCDLFNVIIGKGSACQSHEPMPSKTLISIGLTEEQALNTIRITLDEFNTIEEIDEAVKTIKYFIKEIRENNL